MLLYPFISRLNYNYKCIDWRGKGRINSNFKTWRTINRIVHLCQCTGKGPWIFRRSGLDFSTSLLHFECSHCKLKVRSNYSVLTGRSWRKCWKKKCLFSLIAVKINFLKVHFLRIILLSLIEPSIK